MKMSFVKSKKYLQMTLILNLVLFANCVLPVNVFAQKTVDKKLTPREIAQQTLPSTVLLVMGNSDTEEVKSGSGFFVAEDVVVTNFHVIKETTEGYAKIYGQEKVYEISGIVGTDEKNDLALLKIKGIKGKALKLNADDSAAIGDEVFAVGNPKGLEGTFSQGIVSSIRKTGKFNLLQITASISSGSSGGAVLNDKGEVIGVAVGAIESGQSLNFAIPVFLLRALTSTQQEIKSLAKNSAVAENKVQPIRKVTPKLPNNLPVIKSFPKKKSKIQFKISDLVEENLFGNVKSIKESAYKPEKKFDEWILGNAVALSTKKYNPDGYKEYYEGTIYSINGLSYADNISIFLMSYKEEGKFPVEERNFFSYDYANGRITEEMYLKCAECSSFELDNKIIIKNEENTETRFRSAGEMFLKTITQKGRDGKTIESRYNEDGTLSSKEIIYKDRTGEIKEYWEPSKINKNQLELSSKTITTETQGQLRENYFCIREKDAVCGRLTIRDKSTKLILRLEYGTKVLKYDYEFDSTGNWTKKTESNQVTKFGKTYFEPTEIIVREISYY